MSNGIKVKKRNGRGVEPLNLEKIHVMVEEATVGIAGVSASQVEIQSGIQFYDGITTAEIQEILIKSASDLIDLDNPNYQFVAARLLLFSVRKSLYGRCRDIPTLESHIIKESCKEQSGSVVIANYNTPNQIVISGEEKILLEKLFESSRTCVQKSNGYG